MVYQIWERGDKEDRVVAEIRDGEVSGESADYVREMMQYLGYPEKISVEEFIRRFRFLHSRLGAELVPSTEEID